MGLTVLVGDDEQAALRKKEELLSSQSYEKIDCSEGPDALLDALRSPGLFSPKRFVWATSFESLTDPQVVALSKVAKGTPSVVVARAATLTPKARASVKSAGEVVSLTQPKGKMVGMRVAEMLKDSGLRLEPAAKRILSERVGHDLDRLNSILVQCKIAGLRSPSAAQVEVLVGSSAAPGVPWDLSDAIENNEPLRALNAPEVNPMAAAAYLANRYTLVAAVAEAGDDKARVEEVLASVQKFQAQKITRLASQIGVNRSQKILSLLASFDAKYKTSPNPDGEFEILLLELCDIFNN